MKDLQDKPRIPTDLGVFIEFLLASALLTVCVAFAAHLGFAALKGTPLAGFGTYEAMFQEILFAIFCAGIITASVVRTVRRDIELLKRHSRSRHTSRTTAPLSLRGDPIVRRGVH